MPQQIEGGLSSEHRNSLELLDFIFHIIQPDSDQNQGVVYLDAVQLQQRQRLFFLERLREFAEGTQYIFKPDSVHLKEKCQQLVEQPTQFVELSRHVTADFAERHSDGRMAAGVFVVARVRFLAAPNDWRTLVFLVKMDKKIAFAYNTQIQNGLKIAIVNEVENSLTENKAAIQKSALIDVTDFFAWDVLAFDRTARGTLTDYFRGFLGVQERQHDSVLTKSAHSTVRQWVKELSQEDFAAGEDANTFAGRSMNYLRDHDTFDTEAYLDAVIRDEDESRKARLTILLRERLSEAGVAGQRFRPRPDSLPKRAKQQIYQTAEGVTISYEGDHDTAGITISDPAQGPTIITITTNRLSVK